MPALEVTAVAVPPSLWHVLDRFTDAVGLPASQAIFHFAATQEGARLAAGNWHGALVPVLAKMDALLGQSTRVVQMSPHEVVLAVQSPLADGSALRQAILRGLLEGATQVILGPGFRAECTPLGNGEASVTLRTAPELATGRPG